MWEFWKSATRVGARQEKVRSEFLLLSTPTSNPSSSPYNKDSNYFIILRSFFQYPAYYHWCHLLVHQHPSCLWLLCPWEIPIQMHFRPSTPFLQSLTHSKFSFKSLHYLQVMGTAIGLRMAPYYANLFMEFLEEDFLNSEDSKHDLWLRFMDVIFLLWTHSHDSLLLP